MNRSRTIAVLSLAAACVLTLPAVASAETVVSKLRVEAGGDALDPGVSYSNGSIRAKTDDDCGETTEDSYKLEGANASGLIGHAARVNEELSPFRVSDTFDFALIVCRIGEFAAFDPNQSWLYKVNHEEAQVAGELFELDRGDEVLWFFADFASGENTGKELDLVAPDRGQPGDTMEVRAFKYSAGGTRKPVENAIVSGGAAPAAPTDEDGKTVVTLGDEGRDKLRATRDAQDDIPSAPEPVCVKDPLDDCPPRIGERIVGTNRDDAIKGTRGADRITARRGDDRIDVEDGGVDEVDCGPGGDDRVRADGKDEVAGDCEVER